MESLIISMTEQIPFAKGKRALIYLTILVQRNILNYYFCNSLQIYRMMSDRFKLIIILNYWQNINENNIPSGCVWIPLFGCPPGNLSAINLFASLLPMGSNPVGVLVGWKELVSLFKNHYTTFSSRNVLSFSSKQNCILVLWVYKNWEFALSS